jgi:hypothetical protein
VRAVLHYALLKSLREGSIWIYVGIPAFIGLAVLVGGTLASHGIAGFHYPLSIERGWSAARNAREVAEIASLMCTMLGTLIGFTILRDELASRSIDSIALAVRPVTITASIVAFGTAVAACAWVIGLVVLLLLTTGVPPHLELLAAKVVAGALATASIGALAATISPEPPMIIGAFLTLIAFVPGFEKAAFGPVLLVPVVVSVIATAIAAFLLERRCAR